MQAIILDIDGCITDGKGKIVDLALITELAFQIRSNPKQHFLCTGRSASYVDALSQILGINNWCICENGVYLYHPVTDEVIIHPDISSSALVEISLLKQKFQGKEFASICKIEVGKEVCISLNPIGMSIENLFALIKNEVDQSLFYVNHSTTAVDITPLGIDKGKGLVLLGQKSGFDLQDVLAVGDASGDIPFMQLSGTKACPANASLSVKNIANYISPYNSTAGVIDIVKYFSSLA